MRDVGAPIRTIIVDDEALAREGIRLRLTREPDFEVVGEFDTARAALARIPALAPDVMFLDVRMPELSGLEMMASAGPEEMPAVVFVTAYDSYALDAFGVRALDYLVKPYDDERFAETVARIRSRVIESRDGLLGRHVRTAIAPRLAEAAGGPRTVDRIPVKTGNGVTFVRSDTIDWIEATRDHVRLHVGRETHVIRDTLARLHASLDGSRFVRIHRSAVVNVERIVELQPFFHGEYIAVLQTGHRLKVSRSRCEELARALGVRR